MKESVIINYDFSRPLIDLRVKKNIKNNPNQNEPKSNKE